MNKILSLVLSAIYIGIVRAQVFSGGGCPTVQAQKTFDLNRVSTSSNEINDTLGYLAWSKI